MAIAKPNTEMDPNVANINMVNVMLIQFLDLGKFHSNCHLQFQ